MTRPARVQGFCPMGCGATLCLREGALRCSKPQCPAPDTAARILADSESEHLVEVNSDMHVLIQHPLRERLDGGLFSCKLLSVMMKCGAPKPGRYRAREDKGPATYPGWRLERLDDDA